MKIEQCLKILLVDNNSERMQKLESELNRLNHKIVGQQPNTHALSTEVASSQADIVIIDTEYPSNKDLKNIEELTVQNPCPIIFFAEQPNSRECMTATINAGVSAYIADGFQPHRIAAIIATARAHFDASQQLREALENKTTELSERKLIEQAKGLLMKHQRCDEAQAYQALRNLAMDQGKKLSDIAQSVVNALK